MKKKLLCMILAVAMVFTSVDMKAAAETAEEHFLSEENSVSQESMTTPSETTEESSANQESSESTSAEDNTDYSENETTKQETETASDDQATSEIETEAQAESETQTEVETETQTETTTETLTENFTETETEAQTESKTETESEVQTESETETETEELTSEKTLQVSYHTADEILAFLKQEKALKTDKITYKEQPIFTAPYESGALSADTLDSAATIVRQIRFIAGLPYEMSLNDEYNRLSQSAALVNYLNDELSHEPSQPNNMADELFDQAYKGAFNSNIAFDNNQKKTLNETLIDSWMADKDSENISQLENRSKILNPSMEQIGFGAVTGSKGIYSAMYTTDRSGETENISGIAWPAQNMPIEYFGNDYPWSVSTDEILKASEIRVTLTRESDGKKWNFSKDSADGDFYVYSDNSAQKSNIIFRPETSDITAYEDEDSFQVEISKNKKPYISYTVQFFSITEEDEILTAPEANITTGEKVAKESKLILTSEEDAAIYYTTDGTTPSIDTTLYTEPISIETDLTVKAIAVKKGYTDSDIAEFIYTVVEDAPLRYNITFETNGGTILSAQSVLENEKIEQPETPVKEEYLFEGWFKEPECENIWDFETDTVTTDITLYAKWTEGETETEAETTDAASTCLVTFDMQEFGKQIESVTVNNGETFAAPETPTAEGYTFADWYQEAECKNIWDFETDIVTEDIVLYAKWIPADDADISINASQGAKVEDIRIDLGLESAKLKTNNIKPRRYNGTPYEPNITVSIIKGRKRVTLKRDRDYTLTYSNNVNPSDKAAAIITGIGGYKGRKTIYFTINPPINLEEADTRISDIKPKRYNGTPYTPSVTISAVDGKKRVTLKKDRDYTLTYTGNGNPGEVEKEATVTITGKGEYTGSLTKTFKVLPQIDLTADATKTIVKGIKSRVYNGKAYEPNVSVSILSGNKRVTLKKGRDYTLKYENNVNASTDTTKASVIITGTGEYKGSLSENFFTITPKSIKKLKVITGSKLINSGNPSIIIYDGTTKLNNKDFTADYIDPQDPKKAKLTLTAKPNTNYTGSVTVKLTVYDVEKEYYINSAKIEITGDTTYTGKAITRNVKLTIGDVELRNNKDYKVQYQNNTNAGTAVMVITGKGKYKGKFAGTFNIGRVDVNKYKVVEGIPQHVTIANISPKTFNGKGQKPAVTIKTVRGKKLALNKDYTVAYANNLHAGTASVTIKGIGNNCNGSTTIKFTIEPQEIKKASVKATKATEKEPSKIVLTYNKKELKEFADYAIINYSELANKQVSVTIKGFGDFEGEVTKNLKTEIPEENEDVNGSSPAISSNIGGHNYSDFEGSHINSYLYQNDDNTFVRVECIGNNNVCVESYTSDYQFKSQKIIKMELSKFGGFYAGKDFYFLAFGERNPNKDDTQEVLRIVKYDKNWNRVDATRLFGANTLDPFKNGSLRMVECDDILYIRTCHQMYNTHQANVSLTIQISTMEVQQQITGVSNLSYTGYVSHSFNQYVLVDDDNTLLTVDQGDAYPRSVVLVKYNKKAPDANAFGGNRAVSVLPMGGSGAHTGVSVGAFEASDTAYLVAGNSVDQKANPYSTGTIRNIFVTSTQKDNFSAAGTTQHWITNHKYIEYTDVKGNPQKVAEAVVTTPHLVKLNGNEFMLLWTETVSVIKENKPVKSIVQKSILLNGNGEPISGIYSFDEPLSECKPIVVDGNLVWYYTDKSEPKFCTLNPNDVRKVPR